MIIIIVILIVAIIVYLLMQQRKLNLENFWFSGKTITDDCSKLLNDQCEDYYVQVNTNDGIMHGVTSKKCILQDYTTTKVKQLEKGQMAPNAVGGLKMKNFKEITQTRCIHES